MNESERKLRTLFDAIDSVIKPFKEMARIHQQLNQVLQITCDKFATLNQASLMLALSQVKQITVACGCTQPTPGSSALNLTHSMLGEAKAAQTEIQHLRELGLPQEAVQFAQNLKMAGTSVSENLALMGKAYSELGDLELAKSALPMLAKWKVAQKVSGEGNQTISQQQIFAAVRGGELSNPLQLNQSAASIAYIAKELETRYQIDLNSTRGKEVILSAQAQDLGGALGQTVLPLYDSALDLAIRATGRLTEWVKQHPIIASLLVQGLFATGVTLAAAAKLSVIQKVLSALGIKGAWVETIMLRLRSALAWLRGPLITMAATRLRVWLEILSKLVSKVPSLSTVMNALRNTLSRLWGSLMTAGATKLKSWLQVFSRFGTKMRGITTVMNVARSAVSRLWGSLITSATTRLSALPEMFSALGTRMPWLRTAISVAGRALLGLGRILISTPWGAAIFALGLGAIYIWRHWDELGPKFAALWQGIKDGAANAWGWLEEKVQPLMDTLTQFKDRCFEVGADWIRSLGIGMLDELGSIKDMLLGAAAKVMNWAKEALGLPQILPLSGQTLAGAGAPIAEMPSIDKSPAFVMPKERQTATPLNGDTVNITIQGSPGMDATAIAQAVRAELDKRERDKAARLASRFSD